MFVGSVGHPSSEGSVIVKSDRVEKSVDGDRVMGDTGLNGVCLRGDGFEWSGLRNLGFKISA